MTCIFKPYQSIKSFEEIYEENNPKNNVSCNCVKIIVSKVHKISINNALILLRLLTELNFNCNTYV